MEVIGVRIISTLLNKLGNLSGIVDLSKEIIQLNKERYPNCKCFSMIE